jgi:hypothetical protein
MPRFGEPRDAGTGIGAALSAADLITDAAYRS